MGSVARNPGRFGRQQSLDELNKEMAMSLFDMGSVQQTGMQSAASMVASSLAPKKAATVAPMAAPATAKTASASAGSDITSSDFLTLLVSELKNQDPTQPTDPNAYITQLVGVNSLQQLISINQGIGSLDTAATGSTTGSAGVTGAQPVGDIASASSPAAPAPATAASIAAQQLQSQQMMFGQSGNSST